MLHGAHAPNSALLPQDFDTLRTGKFQAVKLLVIEGCEHKPADVMAIRAVLPIAHFYVRLPDSRSPDGTYPKAETWARKLATIARSFMAVGVNSFQIDNEAQYQWDKPDFGPFNYQAFMRDAVFYLRRLIPTARLISPPLSWSPALWKHDKNNPTPYTLDEWLEAYSWRGADGRSPNLWQLFDRAGANVYWQSERQMHDPSYGASFRTVHERSGGMPVVLCEYGNSMWHQSPQPPLQDVEEAMAAQYPQYLRWLHSMAPVVDAGFVYLVGGTLDWTGFRVTKVVAEALAA